MKLVVIIPAYNEEKTITQVIRGVPKDISHIEGVEILVINDGSTDQTADIACKEGAAVVSQKTNKGLGSAFFLGLTTALKMGADIIVNIDADNQFNGNDIVKLVDPIIKGNADMVTGTRFVNGMDIPHMSNFKKWGNRFFVKLVNYLTKQKFTDTQCGFRAYSREAALYLNLFGEFTYTQEVFLNLVNLNKRIAEVPVRVIYYPERESKISGSLIQYGARVLVIVLRTFRDFHPLKFFGLPGLIIFSTGFIFLLYTFSFWLFTQTTSYVRMYFFVGVTLTGFGFLLLILAMIADMLKRIRKNQEEILYKLKKKEFEAKGNSC